MDATLVMGKQGRLVVPAEMRTELGLAEGAVLHVQLVGTRLVLERPTDAADELRGMLRELSSGRSLVEELLAERLAEARVDGR